MVGAKGEGLVVGIGGGGGGLGAGPTSGGESGVGLGGLEEGLDHARDSDGQHQVGLGLGRGPEGVELGVLELDQPLAGLLDAGQVGLAGLEEAFEAGDLAVELLGQAGRVVDQGGRPVPLGDGRADLGDGPLLGLLEGDDRPPLLGLALADQGLAVVEERQRSARS